jgi:ribosomal-protein-alanine N-acetyltransferase
MNFIAINQALLSDERVRNSEALQQLCTMVINMYPNQVPTPPWIGYMTEKDDLFVGSCAFKASPENGEVEIACYTFPEYEGQGLATNMAQWLVDTAFQHGVRCVKAQTLPEENASTRILKKLNFAFAGEVMHPEDGKVWEWRK